MRSSLPWILWCLAAAGWIKDVSGVDGEEQKVIELVASSPFSLLVQPIAQAPPQRTLGAVEDAVAATLLKQHNGTLYTDMQIAVQKSDFKTTAAGTNSSQIQFFALASRRPTENQSLSFWRLELNQFMEQVLVESPLGRASLLRELISSEDALLAAVESVEVVPLQPVTPPPPAIPPTPSATTTPSSRKLGTLDIVLIASCGLIFLGILYMIFQHHQDRGYIENQRLRALNHRHSDMESESAQHIMVLRKNSSTLSGRFDMAPSTPSTIHSTEMHGTGTPIRFPTTPERRVHRVNALTPKALLGASSVDGSSVHSIFEDLENEWPASPVTAPAAETALHYDASSDQSSSVEDDDEEGDPFQVDVEAASSSAATNDDERSKTSAAMQDWMLSIQVVPSTSTTGLLSSSGTKTSDLTQPSVETYCSGPSLAQTSLDASSIGHRSLEESMASSTVGEPTERAAAVIRTEV